MIKHITKILNPAFDVLSSIPYLKALLKSLWVFSTVFYAMALAFEAKEILFERIEPREDWLQSIFRFLTINPLFFYLFHLWNKRDLEKESEKNS